MGRTDEESRVSFDAQCDLAAVVYGADDDPDRLISGFAADVRRSGRRPVGVVQLGRSCRAENPRLGVVVLPGGEVVRLAPHETVQADTPRPDAGSIPIGWPASPAGLRPRSKTAPTSSSSTASAGRKPKARD